MKEYLYIRCQETGIEYKKLMKSFGVFQYGSSRLFIHKAHPAKYPYVISDVNSGLAIISGLKTPTVKAAKVFLARNLTPETDRFLDLLPSQKLLQAYHRRRLFDLPHRGKVEKEIIFALEGDMTSGNPF